MLFFEVIGILWCIGMLSGAVIVFLLTRVVKKSNSESIVNTT